MEKSATKRKITILLLLQASFLLGLGAVILTGLYLDLNLERLIYYLCLFLMIEFILVIWSWYSASQKLFSPYILFMISAFTFNGGQAFLEVFGLNENGLLSQSFSSETQINTLLLVIIGLAFFHAGALLSIITVKNQRRVEPSPSLQDIKFIGLALLAVSLFPTLLVLKNSLQTVMSSGYLGLFQVEADVGINASSRILSDYLVPSILFLLVVGKEKKPYLYMSLSMIIAYVGFIFFLGARNQAAMALIAFAWLWHRAVSPIPKKALIFSALLMLFVVFPLVGLTRNLSGEERLSLAYLVESFLSIENPVLAIISEMGNSMAIVAYTIDLTPWVRSFDLGLGYLYSLTSIIPNFFWDLHPLIAHGIAGDWLVWTVDPEWAALGGGYGFSFIAEAYLNFGYLGSPLALGIIGFLLGRIFWSGDSSTAPITQVMVACFISFVLFYPRSEFFQVARPFVWYSFLPYLAAHIIMNLRKNRFRNLQTQSLKERRV